MSEMHLRKNSEKWKEQQELPWQRRHTCRPSKFRLIMLSLTCPQSEWRGRTSCHKVPQVGLLTLQHLPSPPQKLLAQQLKCKLPGHFRRAAELRHKLHT
mmetsp:Transcript_19734/g.35203  ORF Transcript_19734/g.35203 Transcript_19734/m.35203 type:complete len:99 (-) Transcript_19734:255-551(-)